VYKSLFPVKIVKASLNNMVMSPVRESTVLVSALSQLFKLLLAFSSTEINFFRVPSVPKTKFSF
jgi:hypothetical protein